VPEEIEFHVVGKKRRTFPDHDRFPALKGPDKIGLDPESLPLPDRAGAGKALAEDLIFRLISRNHGRAGAADLREFLDRDGVILPQNDLDIGIFHHLLLKVRNAAEIKIPKRLMKDRDRKTARPAFVEEIDKIKLQKTRGIVDENREEMTAVFRNFGLDVAGNGADILDHHPPETAGGVRVFLKIEGEIADLVFIIDP